MLEKVQEKMRKFTNRKHRKREEYRVGDLVLLSIKDLIKERRLEKLTNILWDPTKSKGSFLVT